MKNITVISRLIISGFALSMIAGCSGAKKEEDVTASTEASAPDAASAPAVVTAVAYSSLKGDVVHGDKVFLQCKACHVIEAGQNRVGPSLHGIIGRTAGQVAGFSYSAANKGSGIVWTEEKLFEYLENPRKTIPGTKMSFAGLAQPQDRADVIAYLKAKTS